MAASGWCVKREENWGVVGDGRAKRAKRKKEERRGRKKRRGRECGSRVTGGKDHGMGRGSALNLPAAEKRNARKRRETA